MDRAAWQATVHGVAKSRTQLKNKHIHYYTSTVLLQQCLNSNISFYSRSSAYFSIIIDKAFLPSDLSA